LTDAKASRDKSLAVISDEEARWDYATSAPGMSPVRALEPIGGSRLRSKGRALRLSGRSSCGYSGGSLFEMTKSWTLT
jgi:hypothetical protein